MEGPIEKVIAGTASDLARITCGGFPMSIRVVKFEP